MSMCSFLEGFGLKTLKKSVAILLIFAMALSVAVFSASAVSLTATVEVNCSGSGSVSNGVDSGNTLKRDFTVGDDVTLTATADPDNEFLFWKNKETERILSFSQTYTFPVATYTSVEAVFDLKQSVMNAEDNAHTVIYLTKGQNVMSMQTALLGSTEVGTPARMPYMTGLTFERWDHTPEEIAASTDRIYVRPIYSESKKSYVVTTVIDGLATPSQVEYGTKVRIVAPEVLNDREFSYWITRAKDDTMEDNIVSYQAEYDFFVTMDATLEAVYGADKGDGIATRIAGDIPNFEKSSVTIYEEHSVTEDYTVLQSGLIFTRDISIGNSDTRFIINPSESAIRKGTSIYTERYGSYGVNITNWAASTVDANGDTVYYYPLLFLRSYIVLKDASGNVITKYSPIYVVDYVNNSFVGIIEGDNYEDPFA